MHSAPWQATQFESFELSKNLNVVFIHVGPVKKAFSSTATKYYRKCKACQIFYRGF